MTDDSDIMFSRARHSNPAGKLTQRIDVPVTEELHDALAALAQVKGYSGKAEYVRAVLETHVYGELETVRRMTNRIRNDQNTG